MSSVTIQRAQNPMTRPGLRLCLLTGSLLAASITLILCMNECMNRIITPNPAQPTSNKKKPYSRQHVTTSAGTYQYEYTFKDERKAIRTWLWTYDKQATDAMIQRLGIPAFIEEPYLNTPAIRKRRKQIIARGMFRETRKMLKPDYSKIALASLPMMRPLHDLIQNRVLEDELNWHETVELAMTFCQDIPYGIPPDHARNRITGQVFSPPECLNKGYGDCDTKALLLASLLAFHEDYNLLFVLVPKHLLVAIEGIPRPYDTCFSYAGKQWIYCEPTGPARLRFGSSSTIYKTTESMERFRVTPAMRQHLSRRPEKYTCSDVRAR